MHRLLVLLLAYLPAILYATSPITPAMPSRPLLQSLQGPAGRLEIVSSARNHTHLMGYTDTPTKTGTILPDNMQCWLRCVERAAAYADNHPGVTLGTTTQGGPIIEPLLGDMAWDQGAPYNGLCPYLCPTGCVATAMGMVMNYYRFPEQGTGRHSYTENNRTHTIDFGSTTYRWDLMLDNYLLPGVRPTTAQQQAVSTLLWHCGASIDMRYATEGSGSYLEDVPYAMTTYFDYNPLTTIIYRNSYSYDDWEAIITDELRAGRPVLFSADNTEIGHCFVIDGRDADGLFHVNWGWSGLGNGYYDIGILDPDLAGIGGSVAELGYCINQTAVIYCTPQHGVGRRHSPVYCSNLLTYGNSSTGFFMAGQFNNHSGATVEGSVGIVLTDSLGNQVGSLSCSTLQLNPFLSRGWTSSLLIEVKAEDLPDGCYSTSLSFTPNDGSGDVLPLPDNLWTQRCKLVVKDHQITDFAGYDRKVRFAVDDFNFADQTEFSTGRQNDFAFDLTNVSGGTFYGTFFVTTARAKGLGLTSYEYETEPVKILAGESCHIVIPTAFPLEGEWNYKLSSFDIALQVHTDIMKNGPIVSKFSDQSPARLQLRQKPVLLTERCEVGGDVSFTIEVDNVGGNFASLLAMQLFTARTLTTDPKLILAREAEIPATSSGHTFTITGTLDGIKGNARYYARPFFLDYLGQYQQILTTGGEGTPIEIKVYNASGIDAVLPEPDQLPCFDLTGRPCRNSRGLRLVNGQIVWQH